MKKKIFVLFILIMLSGCTVTTNLNISENFIVSEETTISFSNSLAINYDSPKELANLYIEYYLSAIKSKEYKYSLNEGNERSSVVFTKKSSDICKSINENLFSSHLFNTVKCKEEGNYFIISSDGNQKLVLSANKKTFDVNNVKINLKLPIPAEENNADIVKNNTYTWYFDKYSSKEKSIYVKINKETLEKKKDEVQNKKQIENTISNGSIIVVILGVIISLLVISYLVYKKAKSNRLEL